MQELYIAISDSVATKISMHTTEHGRNLLLSLVNLYETIFSDGRFGSQHMNMRYLYLTLANYEAWYGGDIQKSLEYFDKGFEHYNEYCRICNIGEYSYSAPLVSNVITSSEKFPSVPENFWKSWMENVPKNICDELRKNEKHVECFE